MSGHASGSDSTLGTYLDAAMNNAVAWAIGLLALAALASVAVTSAEPVLMAMLGTVAAIVLGYAAYTTRGRVTRSRVMDS